jgi:integrase
MALALTEKGIANATADYRKDVTIEGRRGLILRIEPSRGQIRKSFRFRGTLRGTQEIWTLGTYPELTVKDVRKLHGDCVHAIDHDEDPQPTIDRWHASLIPEAAGKEGGPVVQDVVDDFLVWAARHRKRPEEARKLLAANISPKLAQTPVAALKKRHFVEMFDRIVDRGSPVLANRVRDLTRQAFFVAADRDVIDAIPVMPRSRPGGEEKPRERVLDDAELVAFWRGVIDLSPTETRPKIGRPLAIALRLLLVTAQRRGEVAAAKWSDITETTAEIEGPRGKPKQITFKVWSIPTNKTDKPHAIPLSPLACTLLDELKTFAGDSDYWLPSKRTGDANAERDRSITRAARTARELLSMKDWTPHDLRRTARTGFARIGIADPIAERILNHAAGDRMIAVYNRHKYLLEMRAALDAWDARINALLAEKQK